MLLPTVLGAIGLLSAAVEAAPRGTELNKVETVASPERRFESPRAFGQRHALRAGVSPVPLFNLTNSSTIATSPATSTNTGTILPTNISTALIDCPTMSVFVSTKTIDVTVYISAGSNYTVTEPCDDDPTHTPHTQTTHFTISNMTTVPCDNETSAHFTGRTTTDNGQVTLQTDEPCTDDPPYGNSTKTVTTGGPYGNSTKTINSDHISLQTGEPCTDDVPHGNSTKTITTAPYGNTTRTTDNGHFSTQTEEPCTDDAPFGNSTRTITSDGPYGNTTKTTDNGRITMQTDEPCTDDVPYGNSTRTTTSDAPYGNSTKTITSDGPYMNSTKTTDNGHITVQTDDAPYGNSTKTTTGGSYGNTTQTLTGTLSTITSDCDDETTTMGATISVPRNSSVTLTVTSTTPGSVIIQTLTNATTITSTTDCDTTSTWHTSTAPFGNTSVPLTSPTLTTTQGMSTGYLPNRRVRREALRGDRVAGGMVPVL